MAITLYICVDKVYPQQELHKALADAFSLEENDILMTNTGWNLPRVSDDIFVIGETSFIQDFSFPLRLTVYLRQPQLHALNELEVEQNVCATLQCHGIVPDNRPEQVLRQTAWLLLDGKTMKEVCLSYEDLEKIDDAKPLEMREDLEG